MLHTCTVCTCIVCPFCSVSSVVPLQRKYHVCSTTSFTVPEEISRQKLIEFIHRMTHHALENCENDTKSLLALISVSV